MISLIIVVITVEVALESIHRQGVVHLDWYVSNFMWKLNDSGDLIVKIIDFDSAHAIGDALTASTKKRLQGTRYQLAELEVGGAADLRNYDTSLMKLLRHNAENAALCSNCKSDLDTAFNHLQIDLLSSLR